MADPDHLEVFAEGVEAWNAWRRSYPEVEPDLSREWFTGRHLEGIDLHRADLSYSFLNDSLFEGANLSRCSLIESQLQGADLEQVDLSGAYMHKTDLEDAYLRGSNLDSVLAWHSSFIDADLTDATLRGSKLEWCDLSGARLTRADLEGADLTCAHLVQTDLRNAKLTSARVFGVSAWGVQLDGAEQLALEVAKSNEPSVTVDDLEMAQFIYHLLNNAEAQRVFESVTSKGVLILGRFTPERKAVLDRIRVTLRNLGYLPLLFDFDVPGDRDVTETVTLLARLARFIIADLTDPASIPKELEAIVPDVVVPVIPLIEGNDRPYSMFRDYWKYDWVLDVRRYESLDGLIRSFKSKVVAPAERKLTEIGQRRGG
jgi:uncharacterized protein YjbI with pentapeptide repeats